MSKTVLFQTIQFCISIQCKCQNRSILISSVRSIDRTLSGATTSGQRAIQHYWNFTIRLFCVISRKLVMGSFIPLQKCSRCILLPQPTEQSRTFVGGWLPLCKGVVGVFYCPNRLSNPGHSLEGGSPSAKV